MKVTFNDGETRRILAEFASVNYSEVSKTKTTKSAIKKQNAIVRKYSKLLNGWVLSKIECNYKAKIVKQLTPMTSMESHTEKTRKPGHYRVKFQGGPEIVRWTGLYFDRFASGYKYFDGEFDEIDETPITIDPAPSQPEVTDREQAFMRHGYELGYNEAVRHGHARRVDNGEWPIYHASQIQPESHTESQEERDTYTPYISERLGESGVLKNGSMYLHSLPQKEAKEIAKALQFYSDTISRKDTRPDERDAEIAKLKEGIETVMCLIVNKPDEDTRLAYDHLMFITSKEPEA